MIILFFIFLSWNSFTNAEDFPKIFGCFCEGGVITGKVKNSQDSIKINGIETDIYDDGNFIFAFGRKFNDNLEISINGKKKKFNVEKKKYKIERISGLSRNKVEPNEEALKKIKTDQLKIKKSKKTGYRKRLFETQFMIPVKGRISGVYGSQRILNSKPRSPHKGIDIAASIGTTILAPSSGIIKLSEEDMFFTGKTVILDHGLGLISILAHLDKISVKVGEKVSKGDRVGTVGMTGRATGPHLHWGVYLNDISVDPMALLNYELR